MLVCFQFYMPNKPNRYGMKVMCMRDARSSYLLNAYNYTSKGSDGITLFEEEKKFSIQTQSVIRLVKPVAYSRRNVTADNWFISIELVKELQKVVITYLGTVKKK